MATSNHTSNYSLSQYAAGDQVKFLTNYNQDMAAIDAALKAIHDSDTAKVPSARTVAGLPLSADIALAQLTDAGLAFGDGSGNAQNALKLGGVDAANFPQISSGTWTPTIYGSTTAGSPTYSPAPSGAYYKIGKLVIIKFSIAITSKGGMSGNLCFGGLPFTIGAIDPLVIPEAVSGLSLPSGQIFNLLTGWAGTTYLQAKYASNTGAWALTDGLIADAFSILSAVGILITA